jgi:hypothetical protein
MIKKIFKTALIIAATVTLFTGLAHRAQATEEAKYTVFVKDGEFEVRDYAPSVQAEVVVSGEREAAGSKAFNTLFQYISGANRSRTKIAMTAPVGQSEKIAMTAPVGLSPSDQGWVVSFMLPAEFGPETAPVPTNPSVQLHALPARRVASVRYAGGDDEKTYQKHLLALQSWMQQRKLKSTGELVWARYNAPFTPPFWRRNEILITIEA